MQRDDKKPEFKLKGKVIFFATGNIHKFQEVRAVLAKQGIAVGMLKAKGTEIQSDDLKEIALASALDAYKRCRLPLMVEDAGLFVDALKGFPGPYAAYVFKTIGNPGILKLLKDTADRAAVFKSVICYIDGPSEEPLFFEGKAEGKITLQELIANGGQGFGFDPIFQPRASEKTFAEMTVEEKNLFSHRAEAIRKLAGWYKRL